MVLSFESIRHTLFPHSTSSGDGFAADIQDQIIWNDVGVGIVPIGAIVAWAKTLTGTPPLLPNFKECDGTQISDGESPMNGQNTPNLNGNNNFLRGNSTSGGTGGSTSTANNSTNIARATGGGDTAKLNHSHTGNEPPYYDVVWVMRIK